MVVYVKMHMAVPYGRAIYLVGSCQELGNWNVREAVRLEWNEGDVWRGSTFVRGAADIEYKYVLADYSNPEPSSLVWEQGCNRKICMQEVENDEIYLSTIGLIEMKNGITKRLLSKSSRRTHSKSTLLVTPSS